MTDAPERIWLTNFHKDEYGAKLGRGVISDLDHGDNPDYPEYIRADLARPMTVAEDAKVLLGFMPEVLASLDATRCNVSLAQDIRAALRALSEG